MPYQTCDAVKVALWRHGQAVESVVLIALAVLKQCGFDISSRDKALTLLAFHTNPELLRYADQRTSDVGWSGIVSEINSFGPMRIDELSDVGFDIHATDASETIAFLSYLSAAGFDLSSPDRLKKLVSMSKDPAAAPILSMSDTEVAQLVNSDQMAQYRSKMDDMIKYRDIYDPDIPESWMDQKPQPIKTEQSGDPGLGDESDDSDPQLFGPNEPIISGGKPVTIRHHTNKQPTPARMGMAVYSQEYSSPGVIAGLAHDGRLMVRLQNTKGTGGQLVPVTPTQTWLSKELAAYKHGGIINIDYVHNVMAQMQMPVPQVPGSAAPGATATPGIKPPPTGPTGEPVKPGDYIQTAPGVTTTDQGSGQGSGVVQNINPDGTIIYTDNSGMPKFKQPDSQVQVITPG